MPRATDTIYYRRRRLCAQAQSEERRTLTLLRNDRETDRRRWIEERAGDVADLAELISNPFAPFQVKTEVRASATVVFRER